MDVALDWFLRLQDAPDDPTLNAAFAEWRDASPERREAYARIKQMHGHPLLRQATMNDAMKLGRGAVTSLPRRPTPARMERRWRTPLAALAAVLVLTFGLSQLPGLMLWMQADHMTATGERRSIQLPDGSQAILNTASAIAIDFNEGRRRVRLLDGEVFFDVRPDAQRPFVVAARFSAVEVKGTAFSVRSVTAQDTVILKRGAVDVGRPEVSREHARLVPGKMIAATSSSLGSVQDADVKHALAWLDGRITFQEQPFASALDELRRYYSGRVVVAAAQTPTVSVSGNYRLDDPGIAIRTLAATVGLSAATVPGGILILY
jgi:transmembrane sensor